MLYFNYQRNDFVHERLWENQAENSISFKRVSSVISFLTLNTCVLMYSVCWEYSVCLSKEYYSNKKD